MLGKCWDSLGQVGSIGRDSCVTAQIMRIMEVHCLRHYTYGQKACLSRAGQVSKISQLKDQQPSLATVDIFLYNFMANVVGEKNEEENQIFFYPKSVFGREDSTVERTLS